MTVTVDWTLDTEYLTEESSTNAGTSSPGDATTGLGKFKPVSLLNKTNSNKTSIIWTVPYSNVLTQNHDITESARSMTYYELFNN